MAFPFDNDDVNNPFIDFLEGRTPEAFLYERLGARPSLGAQRVTQGLTPLLLNQFQGQIARQALAGEVPEERFRKFIDQFQPDDQAKYTRNGADKLVAYADVV